MLFNSFDFLIFLPIVFILYWYVAQRNLRWQNALLLVASYYFYSCWDWRFLFLLMFSTLLDYFTGIKIKQAATKQKKRSWFWLSIGINLGFLGVFKYYNFFATSAALALESVGWHTDPWLLNVILPVGISFYTFHGVSYVIDVYKDRIDAERNFVEYAVFVSFFPLLVAGPIERATHLLPQIKTTRTFEYSNAVDGLRQILWGLFKKIVIADLCADHANVVFSETADPGGSSVLVGGFFFAFQIYGDFSGYSDIALGTARLFGIELLRNFSFPYFSRDIAEFWRRWHISLSSWFRDYVYIPLGGSRGSSWLRIRNVFVVFLISGFWHGANWTFIVWGALHALFFLPLLLIGSNRNNLDIVAHGRTFPTVKELISVITTFLLVVLAWIFFRADNMSKAVEYFGNIFSPSLLTKPVIGSRESVTVTLLFLMFFVLIEWKGREDKYALARFADGWRRPLRWTFYSLLVFFMGMYMHTEDSPFIYFQF